MKCKFCGCTNNAPCLIAAIVDEEGDVRITWSAIALVGSGEHVEMLPCAWLIPEVCTAPACVTKAYDEIGILLGARAA